jgi:hypothetical protein
MAEAAGVGAKETPPNLTARSGACSSASARAAVSRAGSPRGRPAGRCTSGGEGQVSQAGRQRVRKYIRQPQREYGCGQQGSIQAIQGEMA